MINYAICMGKIVNELTLRYTDYGYPYMPMVLSCYTPRPYHKTTKATVKCCAFGETATRLIKENVGKGTLLIVEGGLGDMHFYDSNNTLVSGMTFNVNKYVIVKAKRLVGGGTEVLLKSIFQKAQANYDDEDEDE